MPLRHFILSLIFLVLFVPAGFAVEAVVKNNVFYTPEKGTYVETNILVVGNSIQYIKQPNGKFQGAVEVLLLFKKGDTIVNYDKYQLKTVMLDDTATIGVGIIDMKRLVLPVGAYSVDITFTDVNSKVTKQLTQPLLVDYDYNKVQLSDISLVDTYLKTNGKGDAIDGAPLNKDYIKSNLYMTPYVLAFYPDNQDRLVFYAEAYNNTGQKDQQMLATYSIRKNGKNEVVGSFNSMRKLTAAPVVPLFGEFDISKLPSGNYDLVVEIRDKENALLTFKKLFFQRSKAVAPVSQVDMNQLITTSTFVEKFGLPEIEYQLRTLGPVMSVPENKMITQMIKGGDLELMRKYYLHYWIGKDSTNPEKAWKAYQDKVTLVNQEFGTTINYGFETDRGRVYLQYGSPNQLRDYPREPGAYPYQIWEYYNIERQSNVKFVFYNRDLVTNEFELIHSTALNESQNAQWQKLVYGGNRTVDPIDTGTKIRDSYGADPSDNFNNP